MTIETTKPASMSRAPLTSFQCTFALRRGSLNWARTLAWESAKHWMGIATKLTEILTSSPQNGCFSQKVHVFTCTFYRFEGHSQAMRQSLWKKRIGFQHQAPASPRSPTAHPRNWSEQHRPTGPLWWPWENHGKSSGLHLTVTSNDEVKVPKSGDQEDRHLRSSEILIIIASLTINDMKVTIDSQLISTTAQPFHRCVGRRCHPDREVPDLALDTTKSPGLRHENMEKTLKTWRPNTIPVQFV